MGQPKGRTSMHQDDYEVEAPADHKLAGYTLLHILASWRPRGAEPAYYQWIMEEAVDRVGWQVAKLNLGSRLPGLPVRNFLEATLLSETRGPRNFGNQKPDRKYWALFCGPRSTSLTSEPRFVWGRCLRGGHGALGRRAISNRRKPTRSYVRTYVCADRLL